jgi:hypothetical protein
MASTAPKRGREEERRISIRTLVIASVASLTAALVTSQLWSAGTPIAAAATPVIVALVSELLHRPTEVVAQRLTTQRTSSIPREPGRPGPPPPREPEPVPTWAPPESGGEPPSTQPVSVYGRRPRRGRKVAVGLVVATGLLGFAIAATALTVPELITGQSIGKRDNRSTLFGGHHRKKKQQEQQTTTPTGTTTQQQTTPTSTSTTPQKTTTQKQPKQQTTPQQTTPTTPQGGPAPP